MKKRLLACLLTLCLAIGMVTAFGIGASATTAVAEVVTGETVQPMLTFEDAVNTAIVSENSIIKLLSDIEVNASVLDGDYTIDLNGKKITVTAPMTISVGKVIITDSSAEGTGLITADKTSAITLTGGSLIVNAGTIHSKGTFAIQNCERGELILTGAPAITTESDAAIYLGYPNTLRGADGKNAYKGQNIRVSCGWNIAEDTVVAKNATAAQFTAVQFDAKQFTVLEQDGNLVFGKYATYLWIVIGILVAITVVTMIVAISHTVHFKRSMKYYSFSFPTLLAVLAVVTQAQNIALIIAAAVCAVAVITCIVLTVSQSKALNAAKAAKAEREAAEKAAEEARLAEEAKAAEETSAEVPADKATEVAEEVAEEATEETDEESVTEEEPAEEIAEEVAEEVAEETGEGSVAEEEPTEKIAEESTEEAAEETGEESVAEEELAEEIAEESTEEATEETGEESITEEEPAEKIAEEANEEPGTEEETDVAVPLVPVPPKAKADRLVVMETDANGNVIYSAYKKSFTARVIQSPTEVQERYEVLKNALLSYKKVNSRVSWSYDSFKSGRKQLAKFAIRGKSLCLFLALDPATLEGSKYNVADAGSSKKYETVPCRLRLSSKRSIKWGLELIEKLAEQEGLVPNPKFKPKTWCMENETTESLIEKGLIKKII